MECGSSNTLVAERRWRRWRARAELSHIDPGDGLSLLTTTETRQYWAMHRDANAGDDYRSSRSKPALQLLLRVVEGESVWGATDQVSLRQHSAVLAAIQEERVTWADSNLTSRHIRTVRCLRVSCSVQLSCDCQASQVLHRTNSRLSSSSSCCCCCCSCSAVIRNDIQYCCSENCTVDLC